MKVCDFDIIDTNLHY